MGSGGLVRRGRHTESSPGVKYSWPTAPNSAPTLSSQRAQATNRANRQVMRRAEAEAGVGLGVGGGAGVGVGTGVEAKMEVEADAEVKVMEMEIKMETTEVAEVEEEGERMVLVVENFYSGAPRGRS